MTTEAFPRGKRTHKVAKPTETSKKRPLDDDFLFSQPPQQQQQQQQQQQNQHRPSKVPRGLPIGGGAVLPPRSDGTKRLPAKIEPLIFHKLTNGMKLLGILREVKSEYCTVSLPKMLTGFVRRAENGPPLTVVMPPVNSVVGFSVLRTSLVNNKKHIELSPFPTHVNRGSSMDNGTLVRGRVVSVEDHGCILDVGCPAFLKFENIEGPYVTSDTDSTDAHVLIPHRIIDCVILSRTGPIIQLSLPSLDSKSKQCAENASSLSSLFAGMLTEVTVEHFARNGICVTFMGGLYRGAIDEDHLGGWRVVGDAGGKEGMWWKKVFTGEHKRFAARIIAVDSTSKIVRFSIAPHILALRGDLSPSLPIGTILHDAHVLRVDPGMGALLALPPNTVQSPRNDTAQSKNDLISIPEYLAASNIQSAYVHISKSVDHDTKDGRTSEPLFARHFTLNARVPSLRILSSHVFDGIASCATAQSIVNAHVLTHHDVVPGAIYRNVPVIQLLDGGGVLVDLGVGTRGIIPAMHLFDKASHGSIDGGDMVVSGYRRKIRLAKFKVGNTVDVRCLTCDPSSKQCVLTAKKTLLTTDPDDPIVDYDTPSLTPDRIAAGFLSRVDENGLTVTFYNNVHGRVSSRCLAAELGMEDPRSNYHVGDVVAARVVECERRRNRSGDGSVFTLLRLSLKTVVEEEGNQLEENSSGVPLRAGSILGHKRIKVLQLVNCLAREDGVFLPGYAVVSVKSKFFSGQLGAGDHVDFKLPFDQLVDTYGDGLSRPPVELDNFALKCLTVGKRIDAEGLILSVPNGLDTLPLISLRPSLIDTVKKSASSDNDGVITCPSPNSNLFMGEYIRGYVCRIDERFGAFVRFLDGLTGLIPKLKKGLNENLYDTILCKVTALDITSSPPKILLKKVTESEVAKKKRKAESKKIKTDREIQVDDIVDVKVADINFARAKVYIMGKTDASKFRARIHVTLADSLSTDVKPSKKDKLLKEDLKIRKKHPFYNWKVGDVIHGVQCVSVDIRDGVKYIELTNRKSSESLHSPAIICDPNHMRPGLLVSAVITSISTSAAHHGIWTQVSPGISGFVPALEASTDSDVLNDLHSHFAVGSKISCYVIKKVHPHKLPSGLQTDEHDLATEHDAVELSIVHLSGEATNTDEVSKPVKPKRGDVVIGCISRKIRMQGPPSLMLNLRGGFVGRCCITELADIEDWVNMPLGKESAGQSKSRGREGQQGIVSDSDDHANEEDDDAVTNSEQSEYPDGMYVKCCVLGNYKSKGPMVDVSLRDTRLAGDLEDNSIPIAGSTVHAFVVSTTKVGCFIRLSRSVEGRVILKELSDDFIPNPDSMFPPGRLVVGKVKSINVSESKKKCDLSATVDIDMRESVLLTGGTRLTLDDIQENSKYTGVVTRVESYGVFVRIDHSDVSGLAHVSECSDKFIKNIFDLYNPGDFVKLLVVKCDKEKNRLGFSLKASNFVDDDDSDDESEDDSSKEDNDVVLTPENNASDEDDHSVDSDDENFVAKMATKMQDDAEDIEDDDSDDSNSESVSDSESVSQVKEENEDQDGDINQSFPQAMDTNVGFDWDTMPHSSKSSKLIEDYSDDETSSDEESSDPEGDENDAGMKSSHKSRKKASARKKEEDEISRREVALADGTADANPETAADFERLVASSPNSSETWIKYMAFHLSLADIESARKVANRAFDRIEFRQEGEKLNVWTALLTLELKFGRNSSLQETVDRACQHNNPKQVYLRVCELLEKEVNASVSSNDLTTSKKRADDMFSKMCSKFKSKKRVWIAHFRYLLKSSRDEEAHAILKRSHQSLPKYKHVETMSKYAQMEFEFGSPERGRTIFNALLENNPRRMDLLFVNIDKEIKNGDIDKARALFDRVVNPVPGGDKQKFKLSDKQMKSLFKKWYRMEEEHGNEDTQERVKDEARAYVSKTAT